MVVVPDENHSENGHDSEPVPIRFTIQDTERKFLLTSTSSADRILWLRKLDEARKHCLLTERAVLQRQRSSNQHLVLLFLTSYYLIVAQNEIGCYCTLLGS